MAIRSRWRTQKIERRRSGMASTPGLKENTASPPALAGAESDRDQHGDEQQHVDEAGIGEEVEPDERLDKADHEAGREGDPEGA